MKKVLLKREDIEKEICGTEFYLSQGTILTPSAKDLLLEKGIRIVYKDSCELKGKAEECIEIAIERILKNDFKVTDRKTVLKVIELIKGGI